VSDDDDDDARPPALDTARDASSANQSSPPRPAHGYDPRRAHDASYAPDAIYGKYAPDGDDDDDDAIDGLEGLGGLTEPDPGTLVIAHHVYSPNESRSASPTNERSSAGGPASSQPQTFMPAA